MKTIILAGGYATRLQPLTLTTPKHLLNVGGQPMINYLMKQLENVESDQWILVTNNKFYHNFKEWAEKSPWAEKLEIVNDNTMSNEDRLGSIGDIQFGLDAYNIADDNVMVLNADNLSDINLQDLVFGSEPGIVVYDCQSKEVAKGMGVVSLDEQGYVKTFVEKPSEPASTLISTGLYYIPKEYLFVFKNCIQSGNHDKSGFLVIELMKHTKVKTTTHTGLWIDIGTHETYKQAREYFNVHKKIELQNIRSYTHQVFEFEKGITLLSGDIGSGKTSILIAIEFALFGIQRGKVHPNEVLRHGEKEGKVILECEIANSIISIERQLKRTGSSISQSKNILIINEQEEQLTPSELKSKLYDLLGYPQSSINKTTNLFRYTVYSPQEQIKSILYENPEERKDIIRKIFLIDKYKIVGQNIQLYSSKLKEETAVLRGQTSDIVELQTEKESTETTKDILKEELKVFENDLIVIQEKVASLEQQYKQEHEKQLFYEKQLHSIRLLEEKIVFEQTKRTDLKKEIESLTHQLEKEKISPVPKPSNDEKVACEQKLKELDEKFKVFYDKQGLLNSKKEVLTNPKILSLDICPTCNQKVTEDHKHNVKAEFETQKQELENKQKQLLTIKSHLDTKKQELQSELQQHIQKEKEYAVFIEKEKMQKTIELRKEALCKRMQNENIVEDLQKQIETRKQTIIKPETNKEIETTLQKYRQKEREKNNKYIEAKSQILSQEQVIKQLGEKINHKTKQLETLNKKEIIRDWCQTIFTPLVQNIEKYVLLQVYQEFNKYFEEWFTMLLDDDTIQVILDENFTPLVMQNGYDTTIDNLSGGEKTALALSYRLALNRVLNNHFGTLNTKGMLILDEPTDGFSSEQVDTLKKVFEELAIEQLIIVSHEERLEALAQHIVSISKTNHTSSI